MTKNEKELNEKLSEALKANAFLAIQIESLKAQARKDIERIRNLRSKNDEFSISIQNAKSDNANLRSQLLLERDKHANEIALALSDIQLAEKNEVDMHIQLCTLRCDLEEVVKLPFWKIRAAIKNLLK